MSAIRHISLLWIGTMGGAGLSFLAQVIFARKLGPSEYGLLSSALVAVSLLSPLAGFGVGSFWLRVFGTEGWQARRWFGPSVRFVATSSFVACILLFGWSLVSGKSGIETFSFWLAPLVIAMALSELVFARLQLEERYSLLSLWQILPHAGRFLVAIVLMVTGGRLWMAGIGFFVYAIFVVGLALYILSGMVRGNFNLAGHDSDSALNKLPPSPRFTAVPAGSWPFALAGIFYLIYFQCDILLLNWLAGPKAAGVYYVAYTVMTAIYMLPSVIFQKYLLPKQHRWAEHDRNRFFEVFRFSCSVMLCLGLAAMVTIMLIAPWGITLLFGSQYSTAGRLLILLAACLPARFLSNAIGSTLVTQENMRRKVIYQGICALFNIMMNLLLVPFYSYWGSATATLLTEILLIILLFNSVKRHVFGADYRDKWFFSLRFNVQSIF